MIAIIGMVLVIAAIVSGYLMEHGQLLVLVQPAELIIILGASVGTILIANPAATIKKLPAGIADVFAGDSRDQKFYLASLKMLYDLFTYTRKSGLPKLEADMDAPEKNIDSEARYYHVLRVAILAFCKGTGPIMAVEFARRAVPAQVRPAFQELESQCRGGKSGGKQSAAA